MAAPDAPSASGYLVASFFKKKNRRDSSSEMYSYLYSVSLYRTRETPEPWLSRKRSHDRQVSYLDSVLEPPRCRLARALYMEPQIREAHSTLLVLQNQAHNALAKPSPSDLGAERPETFPKDVATQRINYPRRLATRSSGEPAASWRWHPRR